LESIFEFTVIRSYLKTNIRRGCGNMDHVLGTDDRSYKWRRVCMHALAE
jgi:hypothetical protein